MNWNGSVIDGPIPIAIFDGEDCIGFRPEYHLNIPRDYLTPAISAYEVFPVTPTRIFYGDVCVEGVWLVTVFLRFADLAEAMVVLSAYVMPDDV